MIHSEPFFKEILNLVHITQYDINSAQSSSDTGSIMNVCSDTHKHNSVTLDVTKLFISNYKRDLKDRCTSRHFGKGRRRKGWIRIESELNTAYVLTSNKLYVIHKVAQITYPIAHGRYHQAVYVSELSWSAFPCRHQGLLLISSM